MRDRATDRTKQGLTTSNRNTKPVLQPNRLKNGFSFSVPGPGSGQRRPLAGWPNSLGIQAQDITAESRFVEDLGAESIQSVELVAAFEEEFEIEMDEEAALQVKDVGTAVDFIAEVIEQQSQ